MLLLEMYKQKRISQKTLSYSESILRIKENHEYELAIFMCKTANRT